MTTIQRVNQNNTAKPILNAKNTGYIALGAMCLAIAKPMPIVKPLKLYHKYIGYIAAALSFIHLETILNYKSKMSNKKRDIA